MCVVVEGEADHLGSACEAILECVDGSETEGKQTDGTQHEAGGEHGAADAGIERAMDNRGRPTCLTESRAICQSAVDTV